MKAEVNPPISFAEYKTRLNRLENDNAVLREALTTHCKYAQDIELKFDLLQVALQTTLSSKDSNLVRSKFQKLLLQGCAGGIDNDDDAA